MALSPPAGDGPIRGVLHDPAGPSAAVTLSFDDARRALVVRAPGREYRVRTEELGLSPGGWRGDAIHVSFPVADGESGRSVSVTVDDPDAVATLCERLPPDLAETLQAYRRQSAGSRRRSRLLLALLLLILLSPFLLAAVLLIRPDPLLDFAVRRVPVRIDRAIGDALETELQGTGRLVEGAAAEAVRQIGSRLLASAAGRDGFDFRFSVLDDPSVNAFAAPGGVVVVHTGLLRRIESPDELAGVLAHEIAHVLDRHSMRQLLHRAGFLTALTLLVGMPESLAGELAYGLSGLADLGFSRDQERDADRLGLELLGNAGLEPGGLLRFLQRLAQAGGEVPEFLSTHPGAPDRVDRLRALIDSRESSPLRPLEVDWAVVQRDLDRL